ncbi:MAG TPA: outer membrane lipoprotein chaperone LolA [Thiolapillus brandeum]|uniref:Outer-membrane lipoprotein carrier protein n=1 Tax=Thiolapillus brandeum TaxID=1076588 RepID=A0A7C5MW09_9GAMM|nr:outer membrane lipoprotein chaperone LolA [Thiolapillus brandeum]
MHPLLPRLFFTLLLFSATGISSAADSPRQRLESFLDGLHTLMAEFEQQVIDTETNEVSLARGTLYVSRPSRFRWEYEGEEGRYIVADGRTIWLVEPDLEQVSQRSQKAALRGTPAGLLAEKVELDRDFEVEELGIRQGVAWLKLTPRDEQSQFEQILVGLDGQGLARLEMADRFGQVTNFRFTHLEKNMPLPEELFRFEPPPGYDLLDQ